MSRPFSSRIHKEPSQRVSSEATFLEDTFIPCSDVEEARGSVPGGLNKVILSCCLLLSVCADSGPEDPSSRARGDGGRHGEEARAERLGQWVSAQLSLQVTAHSWWGRSSGPLVRARIPVHTCDLAGPLGAVPCPPASCESGKPCQGCGPQPHT